MIEINLAPDVKQELIRAQRIRAQVILGSIIIGFISIAVVASLATYVYAVQFVRGNLLNSSIDSENAKFLAVEDLSKTLTIQNQLTKISELNDNKKIYSRLFDVLAAIIPPSPNDIKISSLVVDSEAKSIKIEGQAANSYAAVEVFRKTIEGATVKYTDSDNRDQKVALASNISTSDTSYGEDSSGAKVLRFTMEFVYAGELFAPKSKNVTVAITTSGNVTDSHLGVPNSIFTKSATDIVDGGVSQ